ncbi:MAG: calcium-translocating P-type ATPase, PMCA-type [Lachnospiraceae bacterium]|nr:calcium-translocating P-type ATPase, PMCA-type [Lachnospiraceae bacterium]
MDYCTEEKEKVLKDLESTEQGLTSEEAARRLEQNGHNKLREAEHESLFKKFIRSLADPMIIMLIAATAVQTVVTVLETGGDPSVSDFIDVFAILAVVVINTVMSLVQESKAESAMDALMEMTAATSKVLRDGTMCVIKSEELVVGDVIILEAGDAVPADCRIIDSHSLKAEESALTGESLPVNKITDVLMCRDDAGKIPLGDRKNMLYSGSTVVYGRGSAVITATGMDTEMGRIADVLSAAEQEQTPLQKRMSELSRFLTKLVLIICAVVFVVGLMRAILGNQGAFSWELLGAASINTFVTAIALAVAAIPEGLPAVVTIILSIGVTAMSRRHALIRKLTAVETLGCTQIICTDKTGTLTQNKMTVVDTYTDDPILLAKAMALCNDAKRGLGMHEAVGEPTEAALVNHAHDLKLYKDELDETCPRINEAPFDSQRKMMSTVHEDGGRIVQFTKGATDELLKKCTGILRHGEVVPMTAELAAKVLEMSKNFSDRALRVLGAAYKYYTKAPESSEPEDLEADLTFIGILGMMDPCRPEVYEAIRQCRSAGMRPIMITGDHRDTAIAIGRDLGIISDESEAVVGAELDKYTDEELLTVVPRYSVYARVQPEHKTRIVNTWRTLGYVTAMTGDGVNDAPSIKSADIGIGMGITGTDVTKGAADMVLADDNFATIVNAVEEGRKIYDNVLKVLQFQLSTNLCEVLIMFLASMLNFTILQPVHLLWINMVTDSLPGLALGMEKAEGDLMTRRPRSSSEGIFSGGMGFDMVWQGIYLAIVEMSAYFIGYHMEYGSLTGVLDGTFCVNAIAMTFITVNFAEMLCAVNMRSRTKSIFGGHMFTHFNWWLLGASFVTIALTLAAVYVPGLQAFFGIAPGTVDMQELAICAGLAVTSIPVFELGKAIRRKTSKAHH